MAVVRYRIGIHVIVTSISDTNNAMKLSEIMFKFVALLVSFWCTELFHGLGFAQSATLNAQSSTAFCECLHHDAAASNCGQVFPH